MRFDTIVCLDDLTREDFWPAKEFIYDLIRVPIWHAGGIDIAKSPRNGQRHNLAPSFRSEDFAALCDQPRAPWQKLYHRLPQAAEDYLLAALPPRALVIGYELTPALIAVLDRAGQPWLDLRLSPLRFGSDLYLALATRMPALDEVLRTHRLGAKTVLTEACLMAAQVRYRRRYDPDQPRWDDALIWVGQTEFDASLIDARGGFARAQHHFSTLRELAATRQLHYRPHPLAGHFATHERESIREITGQEVPVCDIDTYELLAMDDDVAFVGLSSGVLQEAPWFGKQAVSLCTPVCEPGFDDHADDGRCRHHHVQAHQFMSEALWADLLGVERRADAVALPPRPNHLRELHNTWWGYATLQLRHSSFHQELMRLHGAAVHGEPAEPPTPAETAAAPAAATPAALHEALQRIDALGMEIEGLKEALRVVMRQNTQLLQAQREPEVAAGHA